MKVLSNWRAVRLWETRFERDLRQRYSLRVHGVVIGTCMLLLMWGVSSLQMHLGVQSLALRYLVTLGLGYLVYLLVLRWWAQRLIERRADLDVLDVVGDLPVGWGRGSSASPEAYRPGGGGDFGGGGASGDFEAGALDAVDAAADAGSEGLGQLAGGAFEAAGSADEGAVIVVPVVAIFLAMVAVVFGAGALVLAYFGVEALLAVAIELAFSVTVARTAVRVNREGWLSAAVRLTWKPLLGALVCALLLGWGIDHFLPHANSLPEVFRLLRTG